MLCLLEQLPGACSGAEVAKEKDMLAKRLQGFLLTAKFRAVPNPVESWNKDDELIMERFLNNQSKT